MSKPRDVAMISTRETRCLGHLGINLAGPSTPELWFCCNIIHPQDVNPSHFRLQGPVLPDNGLLRSKIRPFRTQTPYLTAYTSKPTHENLHSKTFTPKAPRWFPSHQPIDSNPYATHTKSILNLDPHFICSLGLPSGSLPERWLSCGAGGTA